MTFAEKLRVSISTSSAVIICAVLYASTGIRDSSLLLVIRPP